VWEGWKAGFMAFHAFHTLSFPWHALGAGSECEVAESLLRELQFLGSCKRLFSSFEIRPTLWLLAGWLVKSQLMIHSPESMIEYFVLPRVKNNKVTGVADEDAPEEPRDSTDERSRYRFGCLAYLKLEYRSYCNFANSAFASFRIGM
jgi:hypothetical protein